MYYLLLYDYVKDVATKRAPLRESHLGMLRELHKEGVIVMAGAFNNPLDGAALVFKCDTQNEVERFVKIDPYAINGLVTRWQIREWTIAIGATP